MSSICLDVVEGRRSTTAAPSAGLVSSTRVVVDAPSPRPGLAASLEAGLRVWFSEFSFDAAPLGVPCLDVARLGARRVAPRVSSDGCDSEVVAAMLDDPWHPHWFSAAEGLGALSGTWLHPHTRWGVDPYALWHQSAAMFIGCGDLDTGRRRFDPDQDPERVDMGVIAFPYPHFEIIDAAAAGVTGASLARLGATLAVTFAGLHEFVEHRHRRVGDVANPHREHVAAEVTVEFDDVRFSTCGRI